MMHIGTTSRPPRSGLIITMPMRKNVPDGTMGWALTTCPVCGAECWDTPLGRQGQDMFPDMQKACTECALRARKAVVSDG